MHANGDSVVRCTATMPHSPTTPWYGHRSVSITGVLLLCKQQDYPVTDQPSRNATPRSSDGLSPDHQQFTEYELAQLKSAETQAAYQKAYRDQLRQRSCPDCGESFAGF